MKYFTNLLCPNFYTLFFIFCILLYSCKDSDEQAPLIQTAQADTLTTYYKAIFSIDSVHAQNQYYQYRKLQDGFEISEHGVFLSDSTIIAKGRLLFINNEYQEVEINFDNGQLKSDVVVERKRKGVYYSYRNSVLVDSIIQTNEDVLFDGPNPSFDYTNSQYLLSAMDSAKNTVVLINWVTGSLSTESMRFKKTTKGFNITKERTQRKNIIELSDLPFAIKTSKQNNEEHTFSKLNSKPKYF